MALPTKIKFVFITIAVLLLSQNWFSIPKVFFLLGTLSVLAFFLAKLLLSYKYKNKSFPKNGILALINPGHGLLFLWLPVLLFSFFIRLVLLPDPIVPPEGWYANKQIQKGRKVYAKAKIRSVFKPGTYLAEVQMFATKKRNHKKNNSRTKTKLSSPPIPVYLQTNDYYLVSGCQIWLRLTKEGQLPQKLPSNSFGVFLQRKGIVSLVKLSYKNIYRKSCRKLDIRGKFQDALGRTLYKSGFSLEQRGVALGLILGRSGYMQKKLKNISVELGILHLFAASGLHMGIFYIWFFWPLSRLWGKKSKLALSLPLIPCFIYMFLLGFPISLLRAFTFLSFHALQSFIYRKISIHDLLLNSSIFILFIQPESFLSLGTLLSFGAVSGILYFYPILWHQLGNIKIFLLRPILQQSTISICANLFTLPIIIYTFGGYSYSSLPANILLVPFVGLLMPILFIGIGIGLISGGSLLFFTEIGRQVTEYFILLTQWLANFNYYVRYDSLVCLPFLANGLLIASLLGLAYYKKYKQDRKYTLLLSSTILCTILLSPITGLFEVKRQQISSRIQTENLELKDKVKVQKIKSDI